MTKKPRQRLVTEPVVHSNPAAPGGERREESSRAAPAESPKGADARRRLVPASTTLVKSLLWNAARAGALCALRKFFRANLSPGNFLDCGSWAFAWNHGDTVFKLTRDSADGVSAAEVQRLRAAGRLSTEIENAMARVDSVRTISPPGNGHGSRIWLLVVERLEKLTAGEVATVRAIHAERRFICANRATVADFVRRGAEPWRPPGATSAEARRVWDGWVGLAALGIEHDIHLEADAHAGNWGRDDAGRVRLFDFGQSSVGYPTQLPPECEISLTGEGSTRVSRSPEEIRVVVVRVGRRPEPLWVRDTEGAIDELIGGLAGVWDHDVPGEGSLHLMAQWTQDGLPLNRRWPERCAPLRGDLVVRASHGGGASMTDEEVSSVLAYFSTVEKVGERDGTERSEAADDGGK